MTLEQFKAVWARAAEIGVNVFVFDLGEGMVFPAIRNSPSAVRGNRSA